MQDECFSAHVTARITHLARKHNKNMTKEPKVMSKYVINADMKQEKIRF